MRVRNMVSKKLSFNKYLKKMLFDSTQSKWVPLRLLITFKNIKIAYHSELSFL
jgi:hypothetical protein